MNELIPLIVIIPLICALLLNLLHGKNRISRIMALIVAIIIPIIALVASNGLHFFGGHAPLTFNPSLLESLPASLLSSRVILFHPAITYSLAGLEKIFIFILGIVIFLALFTYFNKYKKVSGPYLFLIFMGTAAVSAMLLSDDIFNMYIFFEIAALTQTGIILASNTEGSTETALKYMILGSIGGPILLLGIGFVLGVIGSVNITDIVYAIHTGYVNPYSPALIIGFAMIFFGWLYASGLPPFNTIKSLIYSKGTPESSAILTTFSVLTMIAFGLVMFRIFGYLSVYKITIMLFALLAMVLGVSMAVVQTDYRKMLGFLAVGELGFIAIGFGIGTKLSMTAGLFQAFNDIVITSLLFIGFGIVYYLTGTSDTRKLGGLISLNPKVSIMILLGGLALAGVPPFNGFQSKLMLVQSALNAGFPEIAIIIVLVSIVVFMTFVKAFHSIYLKPKPKDLGFVHKEVPSLAIVSIAILLIICLVIGLDPNLITYSFGQYLGGLI
ncbi:energy conserving hydrogenase EhbF [Methanobrevibacter sp. UBA417]|jgi:energy-converting hydrogenase B subunit F|uniref:energy conserving hydrogenase EhbF n=3 Tax=unclassified Methanobrevibacter TaxID=2638681 RepID=UPI0039B87CAD